MVEYMGPLAPQRSTSTAVSIYSGQHSRRSRCLCHRC